MKSALRKMGNSTGMILPKPVLEELGVALGTEMDVVVENGRVVATPIVRDRHHGWAEAARAIGDAEVDEAAADWLGFSNDDDDALIW
jgi:antitoxin MazE